jgi:hypothetical protein
VRAGELDATGALDELALAGVLALEELEELPPEEQAASEAPSDTTHKAPARDFVFSFIFWSFYRLVR